MTDDIDAKVAEILADLEGLSVEPPKSTQWPDAKALCFQVGAAMKNLPAYRACAARLGIVDLVYEYAVMAHLSDFLQSSDAGVAKLAGPAVGGLRDICSAEGLRRGVVLAAGDDIDAISLAIELMDEMIAAFTPSFAASVQSGR